MFLLKNRAKEVCFFPQERECLLPKGFVAEPPVAKLPERWGFIEAGGKEKKDKIWALTGLKM
jgi:hypothetical protein